MEMSDEVSRKPYVVLSPMLKNTAVAPVRLAERPAKLLGQKIAVINNGKPNSNVVLRGVIDGLAKRHSFSDVVWIDKQNSSLPMPSALLEQLRDCKVAIAGTGD